MLVWQRTRSLAELFRLTCHDVAAMCGLTARTAIERVTEHFSLRRATGEPGGAPGGRKSWAAGRAGRPEEPGGRACWI